MSTPSATPSVNRSLTSSVYFPNLNGVRFIACSLVLIHHIEQVKQSFHLTNGYDFHLIKNMGKLGVGLFFVLSGFLITYLLLTEKGRHRNIDIRSFYVRRALRIWPLYYLIVGLSCFVFPTLPLFREASPDPYYFDADFFSRLGLFSVVLPNIAMIVYGSPYLCAQTWSIGVEEQFYLLWPWIIKRSHKVNDLLVTLAIFGAVLVGVLYGAAALVSQHLRPNIGSVKDVVVFFFGQFRILTMVIGGAGAYLIYYRKESVLRVMFRPIVQYAVYATLLLMLLTNVSVPGVNLEFYGLFFCFFIVNVAANPRSVVRLEQPVVNYLGKVSYGIYIYHTALVVLSVNLIHTYIGRDLSAPLFNVLLYGGSVGSTILVAALSYQYLEKPFLRIKKRFEHQDGSVDTPATRSAVATLN
ncbi:MAG: acyltransferase [Bacteroidetes bacterium]|nr:acyltransferase [Fibrella sp.]